ncbi:CCT domain containing protein [Gracilaria domingensis]|nr:CCT domain containing protein [Gracilaria domingensis]
MCPEDHAVTATVYCAADACYLCAKCDVEVHNANRLAQRHVRSAVAPCDLEGSSIHDESEQSLVPDVCNMQQDDTDTLTFEDAADYDFTELGLGRMPGLTGVEDMGIWGEGKLGKNWDVSWEEVVHDGFVHVVPDVELRADRGAEECAKPEPQVVMSEKKEVRTGVKRSREQEVQASVDEEEHQKALERRRKRRKEALERFRSKRANRSFAKRVRYECRKQLADSRPRVKGRFVRKVEMHCIGNTATCTENTCTSWKIRAARAEGEGGGSRVGKHPPGTRLTVEWADALNLETVFFFS